MTRDEDDDDDASVREVVLQLSRLLRVAGLHTLDNDAVAAALEPFLAAVGARDLSRVQVADEAVFCDGRLVRPRGEAGEACAHLRRLFARLRLTDLSLARSLGPTDALQLLRAVQASSAPLGPRITDARIDNVVFRYDPAGVGRVAIDPRQNVARCYAQLLVVTDDTCERIKEDRSPGLARVRRAMQAYGEATVGHEHLAVGLVRFDGAGGGLAAHLVAVATYVLVMGRRLGLRRAPLMAACMSALWHDVGLVDADLAADADDAAVDDARLRQRIGVRSALHLSRSMPPALATDSMCVALEVAALLGSTEPARAASTSAEALTAVPCAFDQLVAGEGGRGLSPDVALRRLLDDPRLDARVLKLFASTVGLYPVGSLVRLSGGQLAVVVSVPQDLTLWSRPIVKVVREGGRAIDVLVDLADPGEELRIVGTCSAVEEKVNVTTFLLA